MSGRQTYSKMITHAVSYIFKHFLDDASISEIYETQSSEKSYITAVEIKGTLKGEILISMPMATLELITRKFAGKTKGKALERSCQDVAGELTNMITGTFANQMQFAGHNLYLQPPEVNEDPISMKALYENINLSFSSAFGGLDVDLYYKESE